MQNAPEQSFVRPQELSSVEAARKLYEDFANGDVEAVLGSFDPDVEWREAEGNPYQPDGTPFRGPQEILERLFARLAEDWVSFSVTPENFHEAKDGVVAVEGRYTGTFRETGAQLDCQVCHILAYEAGKLKSFRQYVDTAQLRSVMAR